MGAAAQRGKMRPQQPQQRPMGGQPQQRLAGKQPGMGLGLPMPPQVADRTFQPQPYQPIGANNPPFNPNPVQPTPGNIPAQGKGAGTPSNIPGYAQPYVNDLFSQQPGQVPAQVLQDPKLAQLINQGDMQGARDLQIQLAMQNGITIPPQGQQPAQYGMPGALFTPPQGQQPAQYGALPQQGQQPAPVQPGMNQMNLGSPMGGGKGPV
jgi:hypothetical protein